MGALVEDKEDSFRGEATWNDGAEICFLTAGNAIL
jgi:hypothetical protein